MEATANAQRRRTSRKAADRSVVRIEVNDGLGNARWVTGDLIDLTGTGFGMLLMTPLKPGATLMARGKFGLDLGGGSAKVTVRWCIETSNNSFRAGLEFVDIGLEEPSAQAKPEPFRAEALDYYEIMQLSPNADADTIARVYRMLAMRYHPDNGQTGNSELFVRLSEAHAVLIDPLRRAAYDVKHLESKRLRWKIFDQAAVTLGSEGEVRKR
jgi:hypothetical protein